MASIRRPTSDSGPVPPVDRIPLALVLNPTREQVSALTNQQRAIYRAVRLDVQQASIGGHFDLRRLMSLDGAAAEEWKAARAEWLRARYAADPRVSSQD